MRKTSASSGIFCISLLFFCIAGLLATGCDGIRQVTYPGNFVYLEQGEVSSLMHSLAISMNELEKLTALDDATPDKTKRIVAELEKIESETAVLAATPDIIDTNSEQTGDFAVLRTNHLLLDEHIDEFRTEIASAKWQVSADPPNYYIIGQITGGCNACHLQR